MGYSSGFGLIASPYTTLTDLTSEDEWLVISSDGLFTEEARGKRGCDLAVLCMHARASVQLAADIDRASCASCFMHAIVASNQTHWCCHGVQAAVVA